MTDIVAGILFIILLLVAALAMWTWPTHLVVQRRNPLKYMKNRMMREGNLSARQWRIFRKSIKRNG